VPVAVNLESARVQQLTDDWTGDRPGGLWPKGTLRLAGLTYDGFGGDNPPLVKQRLAWVRSQHEPPPGNGTVTPAVMPFTAQPYKQLADVYRRAGQDDEARAVEIARRRDLRRYGNISWHRKVLNWLLDTTIRYGFQTWRADGHHSWGWAWVTGTWVATGLGWSLATLVVVGYTGLARRD
jgi:hypothetical protein